MSTINDSPDSLSLSGNLKKFVVSSDSEITFALKQSETTILDEKYQPGADGLATIDVGAVIDRLLSAPTMKSCNRDALVYALLVLEIWSEQRTGNGGML